MHSEVFRPVLNSGLTTNETDAPSGLNMQLVAQQALGLTNSPSELRSARQLPAGFSVNPDAADGQTSCTDAEANFGNELPSHCPDNVEDRHRRSRHSGARTAHSTAASTSANRNPATSTGSS